jgi:transcriptional regulator with XRE-family HTH domain
MAKARKRKAHDRERCQIDGKKVRALRLDAELSIRDLAFAADVDAKTITDLEAGRRSWSFVRVARGIAAHPEINVDWKQLLVNAPDDQPPSAPAPSPPESPQRSSLDVFVAEERRVGKLPILDGVSNFGAAELAKVFSSPGSQAGERYYVTGRVDTHRGLGFTDGLVLGIESKDGSRFDIVRRVGNLEKSLKLMVITTNVADTRALMDAWEHERQVTAIVRIVVASFPPGDVAHVRITDLNGGPDQTRPRQLGGQAWRGFIQIEAKPPGADRPPRPHPWALIVTGLKK